MWTDIIAGAAVILLIFSPFIAAYLFDIQPVK